MPRLAHAFSKSVNDGTKDITHPDKDAYLLRPGEPAADALSTIPCLSRAPDLAFPTSRTLSVCQPFVPMVAPAWKSRSPRLFALFFPQRQLSVCPYIDTTIPSMRPVAFESLAQGLTGRETFPWVRFAWLTARLTRLRVCPLCPSSPAVPPPPLTSSCGLTPPTFWDRPTGQDVRTLEREGLVVDPDEPPVRVS